MGLKGKEIRLGELGLGGIRLGELGLGRED